MLEKCKKKKRSWIHTLHHKNVSLQWIIDLNVKPKTYDFEKKKKKKKIFVTLHQAKLQKHGPKKNPKKQNKKKTKPKHNWNSLKLELCSLKDIVKRMKGQVIN